MKVGDLVRITHPTYEDMTGLVVDVNENLAFSALDPLPYRVQWFNPPENYPKEQSLKAKCLEVVS